MLEATPLNNTLQQLVRRIGRLAPLPLGRVARWQPLVDRIAALEPQFQSVETSQLRKTCMSLKYRAKSGEPLERLLPEVYALVREAARRTLNMRHFDVQMIGGIALHFRSIVEMQTGEGKTLTATLPLVLAALAGKGAHLATVNDYLARRDAEWMRPLYDCLGLSVGIVESQTSATERRAAYACDVTYSTAKELGFDFLRDRLVQRQSGAGQADVMRLLLGQAPAVNQIVQRGHFFALVDEADSVLIDDAGTPLVISALPTSDRQRQAEAYRFCATAAGHFAEQEHYHYDDEEKTVELTAAGQRLARSLKQPAALGRMGLLSLYEYLERAIRVRCDFHLDRHYVVRNGEIVIVDEATGRLAEGRKWRAGIHQAIEAQESVEVTVDAGQAAQVTVQDYFLRYQHLAGMTGTAATSAAELRSIYRVSVVVVPTNRPAVRKQLPTAVFATGKDKWAAIVREVRELQKLGRPVLIGTRSIDKSEQLSQLLTAAGIEHQVLNARQVAIEAEIIARAGEAGRVTVSTNMAGRGTDVRLGPGVAELGGLHVIATEMHDSARVDRQLIGRCGRQGDPGSFRQYLALDDDLLTSGLGPSESLGMKSPPTYPAGSASQTIERQFQRAQRKIERRHFRQRKALLYYERQRRKIQREMGQDPHLDALG
ncbi:MAG: preprotein translocase subunit SecA [Planctomycetia bacterium]|nr:preprotein translocase subunit SecA [Planctomycetia bacterium]